ncbi:replication protein [Xenorhabdus hominickii]|uniref:DNA replication protein n=1 Tax=Xenorhabdus hominickii TaxID=351679 RepID=A0A2G0QBB7_XENHO|nr:replication protein [Xenorhabdus hominickii]AOM40523.1 DNA replication protein [Xenorhabdus hominickii]PHM56534.1 DNA replication protein [Xenorhabdus hominickii]
MSNVAYADFGAKNRQERPTVANLEDGYTKIANELLESLTHSDLTVRQLRLMLALIRKTYGFSKKSDRISDSQLADASGLSRQNVNKAKKELISMNYILLNESKIGVNKEISAWKKQPRDGVSNLKTKNVSNLETNPVSNLETHKRNTLKKKEKIPLTPTGEENLTLEILDYFNQLTRSRFQSTAPFLKALSTVKSKGQCYTADEIKLVIEWAVTQWKYGEKLKPENLCRMSRFDGYLSDAIKWKEKIDRNPVDCPHSELISLWNSKIPARVVEVQEWTQRRPAYRNLESVWNGKTNKGKWREVQHMETCFDLISQSSLFSQVEEKPWLTLDWILKPENWSQVYEQAKREHITRRNGA